MTRKYRNKVGVFQYVAGIPPYCLIAYITGKPINFRSHLPFFLVRDFSCLVFRLRTHRATVPNRAAGRLCEHPEFVNAIPYLLITRKKIPAGKFQLPATGFLMENHCSILRTVDIPICSGIIKTKKSHINSFS